MDIRGSVGLPGALDLPLEVLGIAYAGARLLYGTASGTLAVLYLFIPSISIWYILPPVMFCGGFCISFRIVSMGSSFLDRLKELGPAWAGWYRGTLSLGTMALGPWFGNFLTGRMGIASGFLFSSAFFAAMAILGLFTLPRGSGAPDIGKTPVPAKSAHWLRDIWNELPVRRACLMEGFSGIVASFFNTFILVIAIKEYHWHKDRTVLLLVVYGIAYVGVLLGAGAVLKRVKPGILSLFVYLGIALGLVGLGLARTPPAFFGATALHGLCLGFNNLVNMTGIAFSRCDKGHVSGVSTLTQMGGGCLGSFLGGALSCLIPLQSLFFLYALPWLVIPAIRLASLSRRTDR